VEREEVQEDLNKKEEELNKCLKTKEELRGMIEEDEARA
jgi:hypothetical protein